MRILVRFYSLDHIVLPKGYVQYIQSLIYSVLPADKADFLHKEGFSLDNYVYRHFSFSWPLEKPVFNSKKGVFIFNKSLSFIISSPIAWLIEDIATSFIRKDKFFLGKNNLFIKGIEVLKKPYFNKGQIKVKTLTPIEVHRTINIQDNKKKTQYYSPFEKEFWTLLKDNIFKKWKSLYKKEYEDDFFIELDKKGDVRQSIVYYGVSDKKRIVVRAWSLSLKIRGKEDILSFIYYSGLGSRNAQGFGLLDLI